MDTPQLPSNKGVPLPPESSVHWAVRMNYRNRTGCSVIILCLLGLQMHALGSASWLWILAALQFLAYPPLIYQLALRDPHPMRTETWGMRLDALFLGLWTGGLYFPLWIAVAFWACSTLHPIVFRGPRGFIDSALMQMAGAAVGYALTGGKVQLETSAAVTLLSIVFLLVYLLVLTMDAYRRAASLAEVRRELRQSQQALLQRLTEIESLQGQLSEQANRDPLTGLYNRRFLDASLERELAVAARTNQALSVLLLDIDHFKVINDGFGHSAGDEVLRQTGLLLLSLSRKSDLCCRYGGEEFLLLMPQTSLTQAQAHAEKLRNAMQTQTVQYGAHDISTTVSIGLASFPESALSADALINGADHALYAAKRGGRNRVEIMGPARGR
jgi:diguanylate cyclase